MAADSPETMPEPNDTALVRLLARFEEAWRASTPPVVEEFLPAGADRAGVLVELLHCDLEHRLRAGLSARVEDYLARFPELSDLPGALLELLRTEADCRGRLGRPGTTAEYRERFPQLGPDLDGLLGEAPPQAPGYEVETELGRGSYGVVYRARQVALNRTVALKMVLAGGRAGGAELARFLAEAEAAAALQHPNIVQVFEVGRHAGLPFIALEYCPGGNLARRLADSPLPPAEAAHLVEALARAVQSAHAHGIIHRDLKPGNILLAADGTPKVADFGLAKRLGGDSHLTATGAVLGTPSYMAPEQAAGAGKHVGLAADVYALGAILYECLTGRPPFRAATALDTLMQVVHDEPVPPRQLQSKTPRDLGTICLKCLRKEPERRYASSRELADDLRRFLDGQPIVARPVPAWERAWKWAKRRPAAATLLAVTIAAALGIGFLVARHNAELTRERDELRRQRELVERTSQTFIIMAEIADANPTPGNLRMLQEILASLEQQAADFPDDPTTWHGLGFLYYLECRRRGDGDKIFAKAEPALRTAVTLWEQRLGERPDQSAALISRARTERLLGDLLAAGSQGENLSPDLQRRRAGADEFLRRALDHCAALAAEQPAELTARKELALSQAQLARHRLYSHGQWADALELNRQAVAFLEGVVREQPDYPKAGLQLNNAYVVSAECHAQLKHWAETVLFWDLVLADRSLAGSFRARLTEARQKTLAKLGARDLLGLAQSVRTTGVMPDAQRTRLATEYAGRAAAVVALGLAR